MSAISGPNIVEDGLVLYLDAANKKGISPLGNNSFNGAPELVKNLISSSITIQSVNSINIGGLTYYTAFAIDYPENTFGGDASNRHGITPGFNVRSGTKLYNASRALHFWVWNPDTNSWLPTSFFNGSRLSGHCYDSYTGYASWQQEVAQFVTDYNNIKSQFPNATYIIMGSHRDSGHTADKLNILRDIGAPSNVSSLLGSAPEWILIGKPGLGENNAYGWVYENYTTDPTRVAHLNFGLPIYGDINNYFNLDGTDDRIELDIPNNVNSTSIEVWCKNNTATGSQIIFGYANGTNQRFYLGFTNNNWDLGIQDQGWTSTGITPDTEWNHFVVILNNGTGSVYRNGNLVRTRNYTTFTLVSNILTISTNNQNNFWWNGRVGLFRSYNRALTAAEVLQNFNATRGRFGI